MKKEEIEDKIFLEELNKRPELKKRIGEILRIAKAEEGCQLFDDVEDLVTVELKKLGVEVLEGWAETKHEEYSEALKKKEKGIEVREKKRAKMA